MWASTKHGPPPGPEEEPPSYFVCPITFQVMVDPVLIVESGHTYERSAIERWFNAGNRTDPKTNQVLITTAYGPNLALRGLIDEWRGLPRTNTDSPRSPLRPQPPHRTKQDHLPNNPVIIHNNNSHNNNTNSNGNGTNNSNSIGDSNDRGDRGDRVVAAPSLSSQQHSAAVRPLRESASFSSLAPLQDSRVALLLEFASEGKPWAQAEMGILYRRGLGVPRDMAKAVDHFRLAAEQGDTGGIFHLGWCEYLGKGVPLDLKRAVEHLATASERGHARAQALLSLCYRGGTGVGVDDVAARYWAELSAGQGDACGQAVFCMYRSDLGTGPGQQLVRVTRGKLARMVRDEGDAALEYCIGMLYHLEKDLAASHKWFKRSAKQGYGLGQNAVGHQYRMGEAVMKSTGLAIEWFTRAVEGGCAKAQKSLERVEE